MKGENLRLLEKQQLVESYQSEIKKLQFQISLLKETVKQLKLGIKEDKKAPIAASAAAIVSAVETSSSTSVKKKPGRPKKATSGSTTAKKKRGRPKKEATSSTTTKKKPGRPKKSAAATTSATTEVKKKPGRPKKAVSSSTATKTPKKRGRKPNQKLGGYRLSEWDQLIVDGITKAGKALVKNELLDLAEAKNKEDNLKMDMQAINVKISQSLHKLANRRDDLVKVPFPGRGFAYALAEWKTSKGDIPKKYQR